MYQILIIDYCVHPSLIELQDSKLNALETEFEEQLEMIQDQYTQERQQIEDNVSSLFWYSVYLYKIWWPFFPFK